MMYENTTKTNWIDIIEDAGLNPLMCTEAELRNVLVTELFGKERRRPRCKATINKLCASIMSMFKSIGRGHDYNRGQVHMHLGVPLVDSNNPMTVHTGNFLISRMRRGA